MKRTAIVAAVALSMLAATAGAALAAPADLDTTFDGDGWLTTNMGGGPGVHLSTVIQTDGKIVGVTSCNGTVFDFCLARYTPDGALDPSFDGDGKVLTDIAGGFDEAWDVALQADGRIIAAGACGPNSYQTFCLARYNTDGSLDTTFDGDGKVLTDILGNSSTGSVGGAKGRNVVIQGDGKIVLAGFCGHFNATFNVLVDACLARYQVDGSLDSSYSGDGKAALDLGTANDFITAAALQPDGKVVIGGGCGSSFTSQRFCVARVDTAGNLDATFPVAVTVMGISLSSVNEVVLTPSGDILAVGGCIVAPVSANAFCSAKYTGTGALTGALDSTWAGVGTVTTVVGGGGGASSAALQQNGKLVVAGSCTPIGGGFNDFCIARYNADGSLDTGFGSGGTLITSITANNDVPGDVALAANGRILVGGECPTDWCLARYMGDPVTPTDTSAPDISITFDAADTVAGTGWFNATTSGTNGVLVHVSAQDDTTVTNLTCMDGVTEVLNTSSASGAFILVDGLHSISCTASDGVNTAGAGSGSTAMPVSAQVDQAAPSVACATVQTLLLNEVRSSINLATVTDLTSGTPIQDWFVSNPSTATPGLHNVAISPVDEAGNVRNATCGYQVSYVFTGYAAPISSSSFGFVNAVIGKVIPLRFTLTDANGQPVNGVTAFTLADVAGTCSGTSRTLATSDYAKGKLGLVALGNGSYELRWKAPKTDRAACRAVSVTLADGVAHTAWFMFVR